MRRVRRSTTVYNSQVSMTGSGARGVVFVDSAANCIGPNRDPDDLHPSPNKSLSFTPFASL